MNLDYLQFHHCHHPNLDHQVFHLHHYHFLRFDLDYRVVDFVADQIENLVVLVHYLVFGLVAVGFDHFDYCHFDLGFLGYLVGRFVHRHSVDLVHYLAVDHFRLVLLVVLVDHLDQIVILHPGLVLVDLRFLVLGLHLVLVLILGLVLHLVLGLVLVLVLVLGLVLGLGLVLVLGLVH